MVRPAPNSIPSLFVILSRTCLSLWALRFARDGRHCRVCITKRKYSAARICIVSKLLFCIYTVLEPRRTLRADKLELQVSSLSNYWRPCRIYELNEYQQPGKLLFFKFVFGYQGYGVSFLDRGHFSWQKKWRFDTAFETQILTMTSALYNYSSGECLSITTEQKVFSVGSQKEEKITRNKIATEKTFVFCFAVLLHVSPEGVL